MQWLATMFAGFTSSAKEIPEIGIISAIKLYRLNAIVHAALVVVRLVIPILGITRNDVTPLEVKMKLVPKWESKETKKRQ